MKIKNVLILSVVLIFICCIGAASAAEDINNDTLTTDSDIVVVEQADDLDLQTADSDDTTLEISDDGNDVLAGTGTATVSTWSDLKSKSETTGTDYTINLVNGVTYTPTSQIIFKNNAKIVGTSNSYISGSYSGIPFYNSNSNYHITFQNVNFKDISCTMLMQMLTTGTTVLDGCTFTNVNASTSGHNSVIYNNYGTMNITDCTFTNCRAAFGVITNHNANSVDNVVMNVKNSVFTNNYGATEPGAINNCGKLTVYNTTFDGNRAVWWAGAIHTHTNANTLINKSTFKHNTAGWNGGALFTYSVLQVYNSVFEDNNCSTNSGGGAIGSYNYGSGYDIFVENCTFKNNYNLYNLAKTKVTSSDGRGGAISVLNGGYLDVHDSTFVHNSAKWGQAICAYNQIIDNGTSDKPHLSICNNIFENHTYNSRDTVYINGVATAFKNNIFINSPQNQYSYGENNSYNAVANPIMGKSIDNAILGVSMEDIVGAYSGAGSIIYVNCSSENQPDGKLIFGKTWEDAFGTSEGLTFIFQNDLLQNNPSTIILADGEYCYEDNPESVNLAWVSIIFEGYGKNVVFKFDNGYNIDNGAEWECAETDEDIKSKSEIYTIYKNIIFDCPVTVGSQTNTFTNCVFKDDVKISNICGNSLWSISFDNCTFLKNSKDEIQIPDGIEVTFADNCTFPTLSVNTTLDVSSPEKGVVVISLVDNSGAPVAGATISYIINGEAKENATDANGQIKIQLTGEGKITNITYIGNETYKASNSTDFEYNFTEPKTQQNTTSISNGTNTNPGKTNTQTTTPTKKATKKATKITAKKATFKAKKKTKKYTIVLKAGKTAVKKVKVTIKVGKKTYTAKTNTKGKATFNLKKLTKKGKYTAVIKFKGNKNYNATTKKVKITVKK